jgi:Fur family peroxide stress response transcriptional regulator
MKKWSAAMEFFKARCREHNLRITPQRIAIYKALMDDDSHPSADIVYKKVRRSFPTISFDTVNRTLSSFVDIGVLKVTESINRRKRFDPNLGDHHHLSCVKCGGITDFEHREYDELRIPATIRNTYEVLGKKVVIECICDTCGGKNKRGGRR